jgi:Asp-tRNA(Asn)/Glu-tRNA(Gln) amidotransferase A subunit family amidase
LAALFTAYRPIGPVIALGVRWSYRSVLTYHQLGGFIMTVLTLSARLADIRQRIRPGKDALPAYLDQLCDRIDAVEPRIHALLDEPNRRRRLQREAAALLADFPVEKKRSPLFGVPVGVKDIFSVDGFPTRAGSALPSELFAGPEATCVSILRREGALILGKTVTTEFAHVEPGPTRNPHHLDHTPGGSSSGSAAAVAAGLCPLALGSQTIGSVIRPAAFCGIVGIKPSYGRIPLAGVIPYSPTADHVGIFAQDVEGAALAAARLCAGWQANEGRPEKIPLPALAVPDDQYLEQADPHMRAAFEERLAVLEKAGYAIKRIAAFLEIGAINTRHHELIAAEMAQTHLQWFDRFGELYRPRTVEQVRKGRRVSLDALIRCRQSCVETRAQLQRKMRDAAVDLWISPPAIDTAPQGLDSTGDPTMNLPWTHAGLPTIHLPAGFDENGLPIGVQFAGRYMEDEKLLVWSRRLQEVLNA